MSEYEVWVVSDRSGDWERYTNVPFASRAAALRWVREYIPHAKSVIRKLAKEES